MQPPLIKCNFPFGEIDGKYVLFSLRHKGLEFRGLGQFAFFPHSKGADFQKVEIHTSRPEGTRQVIVPLPLTQEQVYLVRRMPDKQDQNSEVEFLLDELGEH